MKKILIILITALSISSCGEKDWSDTPSFLDDMSSAHYAYPYGNNTLVCTNQITVKQLLDKHQAAISSGKTEQIDGGQIVVKVGGNDISGNLYKEIYVQDNSGGIAVRIDEYSLYSYLPVSEEIMIDLTGMYIGGYGTLPQLGTLYNGSTGRVSNVFWADHFRIITPPDGSLAPKEINSANDFTQNDICRLVTIKNVSFADADGVVAYNDGSNYTNRKLNEFGNNFVVRTSSYADFAKTPLPQGKLDITGILTVYNGTWQLLIRSGKDVKIK